MQSSHTIRTSRRSRRAGFSLVELLVATAILSIALTSAATLVAGQARALLGTSYRIEAQQALRASLDAMARDIKLAGACLPGDGQFIALDGTHAPAGTDSITVVTGLVQGANLSCVVGSVTTAVVAGATTIQLDTTSGFTSSMEAYLRAPNGSGEVHTITAVGANSVTMDAATQAYPVGSGFYAVDQRVYWIDSTNPAIPTLMLSVNGAAAEQFAAGMTGLTIQYLLNRNCPTCDVIFAPPLVGGLKDTVTWRLVNEVILTATVRTIGAVQGGAPAVTFSEVTRAKPRNLLQPGA